MSPPRLRLALLALLLAVSPPPSGVAVAAEAAQPSARLVYDLSLAGLPLAEADVGFDDRAGRYAVDVAWRTVGLAGIFASADGTLAASGRLVRGHPRPHAYRLIERKGDTPFDVDMTLSGGAVSHLSVEPPAKTGEDIVPVGPEHRRGVSDPLSAALLPGSIAPAAVCDRSLAVFDGWSRWDVRLATEKILDEAPAGLRGPVAVCAARWVPIAGHRSGHRSVRYMAENRDVEIRFARLPDRDLWIPIDAHVGTMIGTVRTHLVSIAAAP
ncbi:MAG: DUF3108 domain-containing protein [Hyphomicrobiales bacterium]|nr:DUF3108 domain-containing protein [Hyphomicrobiales bacterium]